MGAIDLILAFVVVFIPLIIIHEFGHFIACKMVGISVVEFGIGFPPRIATLFRWGETDFTLNAVPLGGFVMPFGEDIVKPQGDEDMSSVRKELMARGVDNPKSVFEATPLQKIWFLIAGPLANILAALVIFILVPLTGLPRPIFDVVITGVYPDSEASLKALREGDQITAVNGESFNTVGELEEKLQTFIDANPETPVTFTISREITDQVFDVEMTPANLDQETPTERVRILEVQTETPAEEAGFQAFDVVLKVDETEILTTKQMTDIIAENEGQTLQVTVLRGDEEVVLDVTPRMIEGDLENRARIGITINVEVVSPAFGFVADNNDDSLRYYTEYLSLPDAVSYGMDNFTSTLKAIVEFPVMLLSGELNWQQARPVSPVGISQITVQIIENEPYQIFLNFIGLISITLAVTNLLPIPGLDGGRILFVLIEILRGKPMEPEREGMVHLIGVALVMLLGIVIIFYDIFNPIQLQ